jgi:nucleoid-associated protein YgaU
MDANAAHPNPLFAAVAAWTEYRSQRHPKVLALPGPLSARSAHHYTASHRGNVMNTSYKVGLLTAVALFVFVVGWYALSGDGSGGQVDDEAGNTPALANADTDASRDSASSTGGDNNYSRPDDQSSGSNSGNAPSPTDGLASADDSDTSGSSNGFIDDLRRRTSQANNADTESPSSGNGSTRNPSGPASTDSSAGGSSTNSADATDETASPWRTRDDEPDNEPTTSTDADAEQASNDSAPPAPATGDKSGRGSFDGETRRFTAANDSGTSDASDTAAANADTSTFAGPSDQTASKTDASPGENAFGSTDTGSSATDPGAGSTARGNQPISTRESDPTATAGSTSAASTTYTVQTGDSIWSIAAEQYGNGKYWRAIAEANPLTDPQTIKPGDELQLPAKSDILADTAAAQAEAEDQRPGNYTVQPGETLTSIARQRYGDPTQWRRIYEANRQRIGDSPDQLKAGMRLTIPPPAGAVAEQ